MINKHRTLLGLGAAMIAVSAMQACSDNLQPGLKSIDPNEEVEGIEIFAKVSALTASGFRRNGQSSYVQGQVLRSTASFEGLHSQARFDRPDIRVRHFRDKAGQVHSLGLVYRHPGKPASTIFAFENGRIRAAFSPRYVQRGRNLLTGGGRFAFYDSLGKRVAELDSRAQSATTDGRFSRVGRGIGTIGRDILGLLVPAPLNAETVDDAGCYSEWLTWFAAAGAVAATITSFGAAAEACASGVVGACALVDEAFAKLLAAVAGAAVALDRLAACREKTARESGGEVVEGQPTRGGERTNEAGSSPTGGSFDDVRRAVDEFISRAVAAGSFYCDETGDYCVFY